MRSALALAVIVLAACFSSVAQDASTAPKLPYVSGRLLVRYNPATTPKAMGAANAKVGARALKTYKTVKGLQLVALPSESTVQQAIAKYRQDPNVLWAEPDYIFYAQATPNDPGYSQLWGMQNIGAPAAWDRSIGSSEVVVAIIDTGIDYNHEDLSTNVWRNTADCNKNSFDDDGNGYVDDCNGIDAINHDTDPLDDHGHGTHVAGTIGAVGNNGVGVVGVNWNVKMIACKFLGADGSGPSSAAIECLDYLAGLKSRGVNIVASNNSWGGPGVDVVVRKSQSLEEAIRQNMDFGILFIAAAGNGGFDRVGDDNDRAGGAASNIELPNVLAVAAIADTNQLTAFSNYGRHTVHLGAPGYNIRSTLPRSIVAEGYANKNGTSMATPHVTGVAALLKAADPSLTWWQIRNLILAGGTDTPGLAKTITGKRLSASGALNCSNSVVLARLAPDRDFVGGLKGSKVPLSALNINCAAPNGDVTVTVEPGAIEVVLNDDGQGDDIVAGDGIYAGAFIAPADGQYTVNFPNGDNVKVNALKPYIPTKANESYRTITGTNFKLAPATVAELKPPFPVRFGGVEWPSLFVSPHGTVSFGTPNADPNGWPIPNPWTDNIVAAFWTGLMPDPVGSKNVYWQVLGSAPNRELVIEWRDLPVLSFSGLAWSETVRFEAIFFENREDIVFAYADTVFGGSTAFYDHGADAAAGVQVAPEVGAEYSYAQPRIFDGDSVVAKLTDGPLITFLDPENRPYGFSMPELRIFGHRFEPTSRVFVEYNGRTAEFPFRYVDERNLYVTMPPQTTTQPGIHSFTVVNSTPSGDIASNPSELRVSYPPLSVQSVAPMTRPAGSGAFEVTLRGDYFRPEAFVIWRFSTFLPTQFISEKELRVTIPAAGVEEPGPAQLAITQDQWTWPIEMTITGFSLAKISSPTAPVTSTNPGKYTLEVQPTGMYDAPVTFSCSGLPAKASCSFSPSTVTPNATKTQVTLTISTTAAQAAARSVNMRRLAALVFLPAMVLVGCCGIRRRKFGVAVIAVTALLVLPSCGGGNTSNNFQPGQPGTPGGTYTVTVTAQSGTYVVTTPVTLTVK